jgi:hypothetical protein
VIGSTIMAFHTKTDVCVGQCVDSFDGFQPFVLNYLVDLSVVEVARVVSYHLLVVFELWKYLIMNIGSRDSEAE